MFGGAITGWYGAPVPSAAGDEGAKVTPVFAYDLPNLPGHKMTGVLVEYAPGASSPPHHHTAKGSVVGYVLEGAIRSRSMTGRSRSTRPARLLEPPGAAHSVSANASASEPGRLLAVFVPRTAPNSRPSTSSRKGRERRRSADGARSSAP